MKVLREELLAAVNLAAAIVVDHSIHQFTKVWFRDGVVSAFNGQIGVNVPVEGLPEVGGVDGRAIKLVIDNFADEEIELSVNSDGQLELEGERSKFSFNVVDSGHYIDTNLEERDPILQIPMEALADFNMSAMVKLREIRGDTMPDFTAMSIWPGDDRLTVYASDRATMNRSFWSVGTAEHKAVKAPIYIPLDYIKLLAKLRGSFAEGEMVISDLHVRVQQDGTELYSKLIAVQTPIAFDNVPRSCWPDGKFKKQLLIPIPEGFKEALDKADVLSTEKNDNVWLKILDGELTITAQSPKGKFSETLALEGEHANIDKTFSTELIKRVLPHVDRMYVGARAMALFGPQRFSVFIAPKYQ